MLPPVFTGRGQDHLIYRAIPFYFIWVPMLDTDSSTFLLVSFSAACLVQLRLAVPTGLKFDHDLVWIATFHIFEGVVLRLLMYWLNRRQTLRGQELVREREKYMRHWAEPYATRFGIKACGWERSEILAESREGAATLAKVRRMAGDWRTRQKAVQGFMWWAQCCLKSEWLPGHIMLRILGFLEFQDGMKEDQEDEGRTEKGSWLTNSVDSMPASNGTVSTIKFVRDRLASLIKG